MGLFKKLLTLEQLAKQPTDTFCYRCGRELTDPASIKAGIGPECKAKEDVEIDQIIETEDYLNE
jgi:hypothetical protein